jgi:hypothetical protein
MDGEIAKRLNEIRKKTYQIEETTRDVLTDILDVIEYILESEKPITKMPTVYEFMQKLNLKSHTNKVLCLAYFLEKYKQLESFSLNDIKEAYKEARLVMPKNINDYLYKLTTKKGYLIEVGKKEDKLKSWRLSADGIKFVESLLEGE